MSRILPMRLIQQAEVKLSTTLLGATTLASGAVVPGGLDLLTPSLSLRPGALRDVLNFEVTQSGGYARIGGYERFDGRTSPSAASFRIVQVTSFTNVPEVGDNIIQAGTGATGTVAAVNDEAGAYYMIVTKAAGTFNTSGVISSLSGLTVTAANSPYVVNASNSPVSIPLSTTIGTATTQTVVLTSQENAEYLAAAADIYRADIEEVPGSGDVLDVIAMAFNGVDNVYAFRANVAGDKVLLYKSSATGWQNLPFFNTVDFSAGGTVEPDDGETLTQGGVTATIKRVMTQSGVWASSSAAGQFVVTDPVGGNFLPGVATTSGGASVTLAGAQTAITILPGGNWEHVKCNFGGQAATRRFYGCDGVNKAYECDGETLAPITTGLVPDAPSHITYHKGYLFVSYGSSISHSGAGTPFRWSAIDGGGEIATGDVVTGMLSLPSGADTATLAVYQRSNTSFLYGTEPDNFNFVMFNTGNGALSRTLQSMWDTFVLDDQGVTTMRTSLNWGNFQPFILTKNIQPFIAQQSAFVAASSTNHEKGQYRVFYSNGYGLWLTIVNQQYLGASVVLFPDAAVCCDRNAGVNGDEVSYFGSDNGFVYQLDVGSSFDGEAINAYITLAWDFMRSPRVEKQYRAGTIEITSSNYAAISFGYQLGYGSTSIPQWTPVAYDTNFAAAPVWGAFTWGDFVWGGVTLEPTVAYMAGMGENVQIVLRSATNYILPFQVNSVIYQYTLRRQMRV